MIYVFTGMPQLQSVVSMLPTPLDKLTVKHTSNDHKQRSRVGGHSPSFACSNAQLCEVVLLSFVPHQSDQMPHWQRPLVQLSACFYFSHLDRNSLYATAMCMLIRGC